MSSLERSGTGGTMALGIGVAGAAASIAITGMTGIALCIARRITSPRNRLHYQYHVYTPQEVDLSCQDVQIPGPYGPLHGWLIPNANPDAPVIIPLPGHGGTRGDLLGITKQLWKAGFTGLLFDYHGVGQSGAMTSTLGSRETEDTLYAIEWVARTQRNPRIGLLGYSMGGTVAILAAARDKRVGAVVTDSAFCSQRAVVAHQIRRRLRLPAQPIATVSELVLRRGWDIALDDVEPLREIKSLSNTPLLIIHTTDDAVVPLSHAVNLYSAANEP
jgi:alpha/beta superfamily hydrolase